MATLKDVVDVLCRISTTGISVDLNLADDEVAIGGVGTAGVRALANMEDNNSDNIAPSATENKLSTIGFGMVFDGTNWDRMLGNQTDGVLVNLGTNNDVTVTSGNITVSGTVAATQSGTWNINNISGVISLPTGAATEATLAALNAKVTAVNTGAVVISSGSITVTNAAGASAVNIQDGGNSITVDGSVSITGTPTVDTELPAVAALADTVANPTTTTVGTNPSIYNGTTWDRWRTATIANGTTGTGVPSAGIMGFDGTNYQRARTVDIGSDGVASTSLAVGNFNYGFNGASFDRLRAVTGASATTGIGVLTTHVKPNSSANAGITPILSITLEASRVLKAGAGNIYKIQGYSTTAGYIQIFNSTTLPADATAPYLQPLKIAADANFFIDFGDIPSVMSTGITVCFSTTAATKTIGGAVCWFAGYVV